MIDDTYVKLQIWDTAGQERFRTITQSYYKNANGIILSYDSTVLQTFNNVEAWLRQIDQHANDSVHKMLIATKTDMVDKNQVSAESGRQLAEKHGMMFFETSSLTGLNVNESFMALA